MNSLPVIHPQHICPILIRLKTLLDTFDTDTANILSALSTCLAD